MNNIPESYTMIFMVVGLFFLAVKVLTYKLKEINISIIY